MDIINLISSYIPLDYILIILGLGIVGEMLKKCTTLPSWLLTTVLPVLGGIITGIIYATSNEVLQSAAFIENICVGLIMGWAATGGYEFIKNTFLGEKVQDNKIIGAVTHVIVDNPVTGYGILITNMLEEGEK